MGQIFRNSSRILRGGLVLLLVAMLGATMFFCGWVFLQRVDRLYRGHIYPNVYALDVDLGGLAPDAAIVALEGASRPFEAGTLILRADAVSSTEGTLEPWQASYAWHEVGVHLDTRATVLDAYMVGRGGGEQELGLLDRARLLLMPHDVPPRYTLDRDAARALLEALAPEVSTPPTDATIRLEGDQVVTVPGKPGRMLDIEATLDRFGASAATLPPGRALNTVDMPLVFREMLPEVTDASPIKAEAEAMLERPIEVSAYDVLTEEMLTWRLERQAIATWLRATRRDDGTAVFEAEFDAVQATLASIAGNLGDGRGFRLKEATAQVIGAFNAGGGAVDVYLTHPARHYTVQSGDTLTSIGAKFGMPPGLITEANPDIDPNQLSVGQQITVPSQDVLTPYLPVPHKKIVISIAEQRMRVYENGALLHEWLVSTGQAHSPTYRGVFQVLDKTEEAYASQWDLWMPYFIAIYPAGGIVYNGIHELPILANGQRLWEGSLGHPASFGCIILGIPEAETLYQWADIGVVVKIE
jgi:lipoprotein-anchoring transpeptidase ErfK/SrfK